MKYYRMNPYLGTCYEITEKEAKRKIKSRWWLQQRDDYYGNKVPVWINLKDMHRDVIFAEDVKDESAG